MKIIERVKEWSKYKKSRRAMEECIKRQEEVIHDESLDEKTKNHLFNMYGLSFVYHATIAMAYQAKHYRNKG